MNARRGPVQLGIVASFTWRNDPRHLLFELARYKFCAKLLAGKREVLEVGCGDGFGAQLVLQAVDAVHGIDIEPAAIRDAETRFAAEGLGLNASRGGSFATHDIIERPLEKKFEAAYLLDVIEHIQPELEERFITNICRSLQPHGICIIGTPNLEAQRHASPASAAAHINLKSAEGLQRLLAETFHNVFVFSMNDEVVHTGFYPMAHYLFGVGVDPRMPG